MIDFDMSFRPKDVVDRQPPHADKTKLSGSTAYAAPELIVWMQEQERTGWPAGATSPIATLVDPFAVDLWSLAATLYEMSTSVPLFGHSYDRVTETSRAEMIAWKGLSVAQVTQLEQQHGRTEAGALVDLLRWSLDGDAKNRPESIEAVLNHAFFNPEGGSLREDFAVQRLRELLADTSAERKCCKVMLSYCWSDTNWVLGKLAPELAVNCKGLWLDRLGGENGMGEWAVESMQRGVSGADVVVAVVSPSYIQSQNCGREMQMAAATNTTVLPIVLGVPFSEWPPKQIGAVPMQQQFAAENGDIKIFIDMSDLSQFHTKLKRELLPRLNNGAMAAGNVQLGEPPLNTPETVLASDATIKEQEPAVRKATRPGGKRNAKATAKVEPSTATTEQEHTAFSSIKNLGSAAIDDSGGEFRSDCSVCGKPVLTSHQRLKNADGGYQHDPCPSGSTD